MSKKPMYAQIEDDIRNLITLRVLKTNDQIMTEEKLCEKYKVSRMTVNKAITNLVTNGYIYRTAGKGSFVRNPQIIKKLQRGRKSFTEDMEELGMTAGAKLLEYCIKRGAELPMVGERLGLGETDIIHYFKRLRTGNDIPIAISHTYISGKCMTAIDVACLEKSFYAYVKSLGLVLEYSNMEMTAVLPTAEQKKLLKIKEEALLLNAHTTHLDDGRAMEYIETYYVGSRYTYKY